MYTMSNTPVINTDDNFIFFLKYMESEEAYAAEELIEVVAKPYRFQKQYLKFLTKHYFDIKNVCDLEFDDIDMADANDFCDAYLSAATYVYPDKSVRSLEDDELEWIQDQNACWFDEELYSYLH